ncbi:MAG: Gfo/Idh/MocA family oxidoreductase [Cytophagales bacterium]|nr:Gfo/Idh/MocA family oxidoreductase [Cytophagales bacterium]
MNRRSFLAGSSLIVGGLVTCNLPAEKYAFVNPPDKKLTLALVGCGKRGAGALVNALNADDHVELVAMADIFSDRIENCINNLKNIIENTDELTRKIDFENVAKFIGIDAYKDAISAADVVILATPPGFRPYHLEEAIKNDKHVFCEKPVATDSTGVRKILALIPIANRKKLNVVVGLQRHYERKYREIMKRVHEGEIGNIVSGQVYWDSDGVWVKEREPRQTELQYQLRNWYYFNWLSGDHIVEQHVHNIDVFNWAKQAYPVSAKGIGGRQTRTANKYGEIFDHHYVEYTYDDGTILNSRCSHFKGSDSKIGETIIGTKGKAEFLFGKNGWISAPGGSKVYKHREKKDPNPYQTEHDELFNSIRAGDVINDLEYSAKSTLTAIMGRYATYSGQLIQWDDALNFKPQLMPETLTWNDEPPVQLDSKGSYPIAIPGVTKFYKDTWVDKKIESSPKLKRALKKLDLLQG